MLEGISGDFTTKEKENFFYEIDINMKLVNELN